MSYSIEFPAPGHKVRLGRMSKGFTATNPKRPLYATTLSCECGGLRGKVSNLAPSAGGRRDAEVAYQEHLGHERARPEDEPDPKSLINTAITYVNPQGKRISGMCRGVRSSGSEIQTDRGRYKGVQFLIEDMAGKKFWSITFADRTKPVKVRVTVEADG